MTYELYIIRRAQKELARLPRSDYEKIKAIILHLASDPRPSGCKKLTGRDGWRIRTGNYRIIYEINDESRTIVILHIGLRNKVYR